MSVDLPAPFSPRRAWTSPGRRSKSTPSLATMRPKRFVMPRSSSAASIRSLGRALAHRVGRRDVAALDLIHDRLDLVGVLLPRRADLADPDAVVVQVGDHVGAALVAVVLDGLDRVEDRDVDLLQRARDDLRAEVGLVGVDADRLYALLLGRVDRAETARAGHLEDDLRALGDLIERDLLALVLRGEALRVAVERLDARVGLLGAGLEARDVVVHRRDLLAADAGERAAVVLGVQRRQVADEVARLLLLEREPNDVLRLALHQRRRVVDDRELLLGELLRRRLDRVGHQEAVPDDQVVLLRRQRRQVRDVVRVLPGDQNPALDPELLDGALEALVRQLVERAVVEAADVGDEADLDLLALRRARGAAARAAAAAVVAATAARGNADGADGQCEGDGHRPERPAVHCSSFVFLLAGTGVHPLPKAGSLRRAAVAVAEAREQGRTERRFREARLDRGPREPDEVRVAHPEALAGDGVLATHARAEVGGVVGGERDPHAGVAQRRERMRLEAREHAEDDVAGRAALEDDPALGDLGDEPGVLDRPHAVPEPGDRQVERGAAALGAGPLAGVDAAAEPGGGGDRVGLGERARRVAGLVAGHLEADDVRVRARGGVAGDPQRLLDAEVADAREEDPRLDAVTGAGVVDPGRDPGEVVLVREADERGVVGRGDQLDVDRALRGARGEVLGGDVAVVLGGADDARRHVVGLQEVEEVAPGEAVGAREDAVWHPEPVALGDPADEVRGRGALEVDVQLRLGDHHARRSRIAGVSAGGSSPTVNAARRAATAASASASVRAWTIASGRSAGPTRSPGAATSLSPTAWSTSSASWRRPPPRATTARPTARTSIACTTPPRSGVAATMRTAAGRCASGFSRRSAGPPSAATIFAKRSAAAPLRRASAGSAPSILPSRSSSRESSMVTSTSRGSLAAPVRWSID